MKSFLELELDTSLNGFVTCLLTVMDIIWMSITILKIEFEEEISLYGGSWTCIELTFSKLANAGENIQF